MKYTSRKFLVEGIILVGLFLSSTLYAQDTLPNFSVVDKGNGRVIISWKNPFSSISQIAIQRSYDSLKQFSSIYSIPSPELPENGFTDKVNPNVKVYYRIFFVQQNGNYFFTRSQSPGFGISIAPDNESRRDQLTDLVKETSRNPAKKISIIAADTLYQTISGSYQFQHFRDSVIAYTRDTLYSFSPDSITIKQYVRPYTFKSSMYVYTDKNGYVTINLPDAMTKIYDLRIFEEDGTTVFEVNRIKHTYITLDKSNFYHAGWYKFELIEDGKIKDRNKLFVPKDF